MQGVKSIEEDVLHETSFDSLGLEDAYSDYDYNRSYNYIDLKEAESESEIEDEVEMECARLRCVPLLACRRCRRGPL